MTPEQRLARLVRNARRGWHLAANDSRVRDRARQWLARHPSALPEVDDLWLLCLDGQGPLWAWLQSNADPDAWRHPVPLHSVLAGHPFPDLPQWVEATK